jgi:integrase
MPRGINKLSARAVAAAKEPGLLGDGAGLYLQVSDVNGNGITKAWCFRFMLNGRARKMGLGSINDFTLAEARDRARQARQLLADGRDPIEARLAERDARRRDEAGNITFRDAAAKYLATHEAGWKNAKHRQQWRNTLATYVYPTIGTRPVAAIDAALVNGCLVSIWTETPETARRLRQRVEKVCQWVRDGMPLPAPSKAKRVRHHPALPWQEVPAFMVELRQRDSISAKALEFTILCAARTGETIGARWPEIDFDGRVWTVPAERMKGHTTHRVPLPDRAVEILRDLPRIRGEHHVFPGAKKGAGLSNMSMLELLRGMRPGLTVHGFRSTFKTWASEATNHPNIVSEAALAHTIPDKVEAAYRRGELFDKRRRLMKDWSTYCVRPPVEKAANVTPIRGRA